MNFANMLAKLIKEHQEIIDAMLAKDVERARVAITRHVENQEENILRTIKDKKI